MPNRADLIRDVTHPEVPEDERFDLNGELSTEFMEEMARPDQGDIREALPYLLTEDLTAKSTQLMTDRITFGTYPSSKRFDVKDKAKGRRHVPVREVNEYGVVSGAGDRSRLIERSSSGFDFLKSPRGDRNILIRQQYFQ